MPESVQPNETNSAPHKSSFIARQAEKLSDHLWGWIFSGGLVVALAFLARKRAFLLSLFWYPRVPLIFLLLVAVPALFAITVIFRHFFAYRSPRVFTVTDPIQSMVMEAYDGSHGSRLLIYSLYVTFANPSKAELLIMYAYFKGTKPITHFFDPVDVGPEQAMIRVHLHGQCTMPRRPMSNPYDGTVTFVEVTGARYREKVKLRYIPLPRDFKPPFPPVSNPSTVPPP